MRFLFVALMILLLPLRGWLGDAMATQMAAPGLSHQVAIGPDATEHAHDSEAPTHPHPEPAQSEASAAVADCTGHAGSGDPSPSEPSHCQTCGACQVCHTVALSVPIAVFFELSNSEELPQRAAPSFTSAERALGLKPPIS